MRCLGYFAVLAGLGVASAPRASAQETDDHLYPRYEAAANGTLLVLSETTRIDSKNNPDPGTEIDAEDVLGVGCPSTNLQKAANLGGEPGLRGKVRRGAAG
jgi:hypothetical protein